MAVAGWLRRLFGGGKSKEDAALDWTGKGLKLFARGRVEQAIACLDRALEINPRLDPAWLGKGVALERLGRAREAVECYRQFCALAPAEYAPNVAQVRERIRELEGR